MLTSFSEGRLQETVSNLGEFLSVCYDLGLISNLIYGHFKMLKRQEDSALLFSLSVSRSLLEMSCRVIEISRRMHNPRILVKGNG